MMSLLLMTKKLMKYCWWRGTDWRWSLELWSWRL